ncbi:MAG: NAD(P)H-dependent glycerol-3-phosphate dehydrogenase [Gammaproteobacteria bacterium]|nr:NAD(P)H-dependent glycerol-3-phosphate dehydrogenase [Gammaproteobacteria bacterium]
MKRTVLVLGAGAWGTALAIATARDGHDVLLWGRNDRHIQRLQHERSNQRYLPGVSFPDNLRPVASLDDLSAGIDDIVIAVPCAGLSDAVTAVKDRFDLNHTGICLACKGLAAENGRLNHEMVNSIAGEIPVAVFSGPSFAGELAAGLPTAVTIASTDSDYASRLQQLFHSETLRIYTHDDVIGVEIGGAIKNVMAIAAGIADGLGFGANTRTAVITRGLAEIMRLGVALGGRAETFMGLAGLGDLVLTCTDDQSRNRRLGLALGRGETLEQASAAIGQVIEGARTAATALSLAEKHGIVMPITEQVVAVIEGKCTPREAVQALLAREPKAETE